MKRLLLAAALAVTAIVVPAPEATASGGTPAEAAYDRAVAVAVLFGLDDAGRNAYAQVRAAWPEQFSGTAAPGAPLPSSAPVEGLPMPAPSREPGSGAPAVGSPQPAPVATSPVSVGQRPGAICPVQGRIWHQEDWGAPRSGGRTHEGNDVFAERGTPIVAIDDGILTEVHDTDSTLGGRYVIYVTVSNDRWYIAHMEDIAPGLQPGQVLRRGELLGHVGSSGNARGKDPHAHIELRPGGVTKVDPYPVLKSLCGS